MLQKIRGESEIWGTGKCRETGAGEFPRGHDIYRRWSKYFSIDKKKGIVLDGKNFMLLSVLSMGGGKGVEFEAKKSSDELDISV